MGLHFFEFELKPTGKDSADYQNCYILTLDRVSANVEKFKLHLGEGQKKNYEILDICSNCR